MADGAVSMTDGNLVNGQTLIAGASVRSAAHSAVRAGLRPVGIDCFADEDLRAVADVLPMRNDPDDLPRLAADVAPGPWMYTGALENHPAIIAEISAHRPLWGNSAEVVRTVRDPFRLHEVLRTAGLPVADLRSSSHPPAPDGRWMLKPLRGSAGRGIHIWERSAAAPPTLDEPHYFQVRLTGRPLSALFIASNDGCRLIGMARQFIGKADLNAPPFSFCGAIAPFDPGSTVRKTIQQHGELLTHTCSLRGLFGIDFLCDGRQARLTELNPRYTATVELFEHALGIPLLEEHRQACQGSDGPTPPRSDFLNRTDHRVAKAILYADQNRVVPTGIEPFSTAWQTDAFLLPAIADIPSSGTRIAAGHPICTVFADGQTERECLHALRRRTRNLWKILTATPSHR